MPAYQLDQFLPDIDPSCWIAPCATIIGNVVVGSGSSIWFGSVVRGDNEPIVIGERINIQDGSILQSDPGSPLRIGNDTTVGHRAVVHGCTIGTASVADRPRLDATTASR
jgi:carbonic anhydrase/acetyltransferase-like protein (isoleucine patch superfamily)